MVDNLIEDDDLISQDDIDALLQSSQIGDMSDSDDSDTEGDMGELSQDDIDSLLNSNSLDFNQDSDDDSDDEFSDDEMELISQDDIDQLMSSQSGNRKPISEEIADPAETDDDDDDISMLISQDDINEMLDTQVKLTDTQNDIVEDETDGEPLEERPAVILDEPNPDPGDDLQQRETGTFDEDVIDDSEATPIKDCLITQEALDALVDRNVSPPGESAEAAPDSKILLESEVVELDFDLDQIESELDLDTGQKTAISPGDTVNLFSEDTDEGTVSQEDIDSLLSETDEDDDIDSLLNESGNDEIFGDDDILISQDDIDALLTASDQEDEDILGDLLDEASESVIEEDEAEEETDDDSDEDQVVLEGIDTIVSEPGSAQKEVEDQHRWYRSKLILAGISGLLFLVIFVPVSYFFFFSQESSNQTADRRMMMQETKSREVTVESVDINLVEKPAALEPGTMVLKDFLILASEDSKALTYVSADIIIDYTDKKAYFEINDNLPFYRELIYESIQKSINSDKGEDITEPEIIEVVELALKKVLPAHYINNIRFDAFKAG